MPDHARKQIRDAVETAMTGLTTTGSNVSVTRAWPHEAANVPAWHIRTDSEAADPEMESQNAVYRELTLRLTGIARASDDTLDDTLDTMAAEAEAVLGANNLGGLVLSLRLMNTEFEYSREGDKPIGTIDMEWLAEYRTAANDPTAIV